MKKNGTGRYERTAKHRKACSLASKKYWSSLRRSKAMKKAHLAKRKSAKMKAVWAFKKTKGIPFGKWKPSVYSVPPPALTHLERMEENAKLLKKLKKQKAKDLLNGTTKADSCNRAYFPTPETYGSTQNAERERIRLALNLIAEVVVKTLDRMPR